MASTQPQHRPVAAAMAAGAGAQRSAAAVAGDEATRLAPPGGSDDVAKPRAQHGGSGAAAAAGDTGELSAAVSGLMFGVVMLVMVAVLGVGAAYLIHDNEALSAELTAASRHLLPATVADTLQAYHRRWFGSSDATAAKPVVEQRAYTRGELRKHDGSDPALPILLGYRGVVYDVTAGRRYYAPGGSYAFFAGRDASRAYVTGCFEPQCLVEDLTGLTIEQRDDLAHWTRLYEDKYTRVGYLVPRAEDPTVAALDAEAAAASAAAGGA